MHRPALLVNGLEQKRHFRRRIKVRAPVRFYRHFAHDAAGQRLGRHAYVRIVHPDTVGTREENDILVKALEAALKERT